MSIVADVRTMTCPCDRVCCDMTPEVIRTSTDPRTVLSLEQVDGTDSPDVFLANVWNALFKRHEMGGGGKWRERSPVRE